MLYYLYSKGYVSISTYLPIMLMTMMPKNNRFSEYLMNTFNI